MIKERRWISHEIHTEFTLSALSELSVGTAAVVESLDLPDEIGHQLMHMGFAPEARVVVIRRAPAGDPTVYSIDGFEIALRHETACHIRVRPQQDGRR
jgi:ferrous iron transport protein A